MRQQPPQRLRVDVHNVDGHPVSVGAGHHCDRGPVDLGSDPVQPDQLAGGHNHHQRRSGAMPDGRSARR